MMRKYIVYLLINRSKEEVFFGLTEDLNSIFAECPPEIAHWNLREDFITNPVMIEEELLQKNAVSLIHELQEKSLRNPQGKKILINQTIEIEQQ